jgi:hypothetical protein
MEVSSVESALLAAFEDVFDCTIEKARRMTDFSEGGLRGASLEPAYGR